MKRLKKIITFIAGTAALSAMAVTAFASTITQTVSCYKSDEQTYKSGGVEFNNFYDYGTFLPFDNARIYAKATTTGKKVTAYIYYAPFGSDNFKEYSESTSDKNKNAVADYNPSGVDMLEPRSYALSQGDGVDMYLRVTY